MKLFLPTKKDKNKDTYFSFWYIWPLQIVALLPAVDLFILSDLYTINFVLEKIILIISLICCSTTIFRKIKNLEITQKMDAMGFKWPDWLTKIALFLEFYLSVSIILVWGALEINRNFGNSQPQSITGTVTRKIRSEEIVRTTYKLGVKPQIPELDKSTVLSVSYNIYGKLNIGSKVNIMLKEGALGYPYIADVTPYETTGEGSADDKGQ